MVKKENVRRNFLNSLPEAGFANAKAYPRTKKSDALPGNRILAFKYNRYESTE
jgi:hypothetical protein